MNQKFGIGCVTENESRFFVEVGKHNLQSVVDLVLQKPPTSINKLVKFNQDDTIDEICLIILDLCKWFNVKNNISEEQIYGIAEMVISEYKFLTLLDLGLCFKFAKLGKYGKVYDRIDGGLVLYWLKMYEEERTETIVNKRLRQNDAHKGDNSTRSSETTLKKALKKWDN